MPKRYNLPFSSFLPGQEEAILCLQEITQQHKISGLFSPPGTGKSAIYMAVSAPFRTLIVTSTKGLQDQIARSFPRVVSVKGHSSYPCGSNGTRERDSVAARSILGRVTALTSRGDKCYRGENCFFLRAVEKSLQSTHVVTNYALWLTLERTGKEKLLGNFDLVVFDEAHNIEDWVTSYGEFALREEDLRAKLGVCLPSTCDDYEEWIEKNVLPHCNKEFLSVFYSEKWLFSRSGRDLRITPVTFSSLIHPLLYREAQKIILSSAVLDKPTAKTLGCTQSLSLPPPSPPQNRPFILSFAGRVDFRARQDPSRLRSIVDRIDTIIRNRPDRKGIIHCRSFSWQEKILSLTRFKDRIITHGRGQSRQAVESFISSPNPKILLSPSVEEGYDFPDDLCRYQIILKVPFPDSRDELTKARKSSIISYSDSKAATAIVQMYGRPNRSKLDWSETFLLDAHWNHFSRRAKLPDWLLAAVVADNGSVLTKGE